MDNRGRFAVAGVLALLLIATPASGNTTRLHDPNDTAGKLDVKLVIQGHRSASTGPDLLRHRFTMHARWRKRALNRENNFINLFFDTDEDKGFERRLNIDERNGELRRKMQTWRDLDKVGEAKICALTG